jgi:hypothetical protein
MVVSQNLVAFMVTGPFHLAGTKATHQGTEKVPPGCTYPQPETVPILVARQLAQHLEHLQTTAALIGVKGEHSCSAMHQQAVQPDSAWSTIFAQAPFGMTISRLLDGKIHVVTQIHRRDGTVRDVSLFAAPIDPNDPESFVRV